MNKSITNYFHFRWLKQLKLPLVYSGNSPNSTLAILLDKRVPRLERNLSLLTQLTSLASIMLPLKVSLKITLMASVPRRLNPRLESHSESNSTLPLLTSKLPARKLSLRAHLLTVPRSLDLVWEEMPTTPPRLSKVFLSPTIRRRLFSSEDSANSTTLSLKPRAHEHCRFKRNDDSNLLKLS